MVYADVLELSFDVDILAILGLTTVSATFSKNRHFLNLLVTIAVKGKHSSLFSSG